MPTLPSCLFFLLPFLKHCFPDSALANSLASSVLCEVRALGVDSPGGLWDLKLCEESSTRRASFLKASETALCLLAAKSPSLPSIVVGMCYVLAAQDSVSLPSRISSPAATGYTQVGLVRLLPSPSPRTGS